MSEEKKNKVSYSSIDTYSRCPYLYKLKYVDKIKSDEHGASLDFGIIIDYVSGLMFSELKSDKKSDYFDIFMNYKSKDKDDNVRGWNLVYDDPNIHYVTNDLDRDLLEPEDLANIKLWENEIGVTLSDAIKAEKSKRYKYFNDENRKLFYRAAWISMKYKGYYIIESIKKYILPKIDNVIAIQQKVEGDINKSDYIGYIDLIAKVNAHTMDGKLVSRPVVIDIKTSARPYDDDRIDYSEQLMMYLAHVKEELKTNYVGYIVFVKNIPKDYICPECGWKRPKSSKVFNCNNKSSGKRCNVKLQKFPKAPKPQIQIKNIAHEKMTEFIKSTIDWAKTIENAKETNSFPKNFKACKDFGLCDCWDTCHGEK